MIEELNACPFCGGKAKIIDETLESEHFYTVLCEECGALIPASKDKQVAIDIWNKRNDDLLPCPLCGSKASVSEFEADDKKYSIVVCETCMLSTFGSENEAEVKAAWNRRK